MAHALYRKYRPQIFEDVVGQEHIERTLKNAIATDKVSHAYLFTGPRGTGKTTTARLLAKALLCENGPTPDPDGTCEDCELVADGEHPDVYELDAASRTGVENVREEIIGRVGYAPTRGRYKVYIIDEVHMLSVAAFNALLKTLEEPPSHVIFVLCTTDPQKVPETIHSRCQRFDFRRIASEEMIARLGAICEMEGIEYEGDALDLIAHRAQGGMRDALTSLEQLIAFGEGKVTMEQASRLLGSMDSSELAEIVSAIGQRDAAACFRWTSDYMETGVDLVQFTQDLTQHMRDMYVMSLTGADVALEISESARREMESELQWFGSDRLANMLFVLSELMSELKTSTNQRLSFEIALTRMVHPESDITMRSLAERIERLEAGGLPAPMGAGVSSGRVIDVRSAIDEDPNAGIAAMDSSGVTPTDVHPVASDTQVDEVSVVDAQPSGDSVGEVISDSHAPGGISDLSRVWDSVMNRLSKVNPAYGVLLMDSRPFVEQPSGDLVIGFSPENDFTFKSVQKPEVRDAIRGVLDSVGFSGVPFRIERVNIETIPAPNASRTDAPSDTSRFDQPISQPVDQQASSEPDFMSVLETTFGEGIKFEEV